MAEKYTQIYTIIDQATQTLDDVSLAMKKTTAAVDENTEAHKRSDAAVKRSNSESRKTVEGLRTVTSARTVETKQVSAQMRAYQRLIQRYDETARVTARVAAATKIFNAELKSGRIGQAEYEKRLMLVKRGIEDQTLAARRGAVAQLSFSKVMERVTFVLKTFIATLAVRAVYEFATGVTDAALAVEKMNSTLLAATGSLVESRNALEFVKSTASSLGLVYKDMAIQYSKFVASTRNTALEEQTDKIFSGFSKAAVALRLSSAETEGIFRALIQMVSKGTVQAEELRGQLGERLPGALKIASDALGVTTMQLGKMLEQGQVLAEDLLPSMSDALEDIYGDQARAAADGMQGSINALKNSWFELLVVLSAGTAGSAIKGMFDIGSAVLNSVALSLSLAGIAIDKFQVSVLGAVRLFDNLDNVSLSGVMVELGRVDQMLRQLERQQASVGILDAQQKDRVQDLIIEYSAYRVDLEAVAHTLGNVAEKTDDLSLAQTKAENSLQGLVDKFDPLSKVTREYEEGLTILNNAFLELNITDKQQLALMGKLDAAYGKAAASALGLKSANAARSRAERQSVSAEQKELRRFTKSQQIMIKQKEELGKSDTALQTQLQINQAWKAGARDLTDLTNAMALQEVERASLVTSRKRGFQPDSPGEKKLVSDNVRAEQLSQENRHLEEQRRSYERLATDADKYKFALEDIYDLHEKGSPAATEAIRRLNIQYSGLLDTTEQLKFGMTEAFDSVREQAGDIFDDIRITIERSFRGAEDAIIGFVKSGKLEFGSLVDSILADLLRIATQKAITEPLAAALGSAFSGFGSGTASVASAAASGGGGTGHGVSSMGFRTGGAFTIPGTGATDSKIISFRGAPGERVTIDPVGTQGKPSGNGGGSNMNVTVINNSDNSTVRQEESRDANGIRQLQVFIENTVARSITGNGSVGRSIDNTRGTRQVGVIR